MKDNVFSYRSFSYSIKEVKMLIETDYMEMCIEFMSRIGFNF